MLFAAVCACVVLVAGALRPEEVSSFFLKAPKSVPRAGRAAPGDFESFFLKASKSVPRVGRRGGSAVESYSPYEQQLRDLLYGPEIRKTTQNDDLSGSDSYNYSPDYSQYYRTLPNANSFQRQNDYTLATFPSDMYEGNINHRSRRFNTPPAMLSGFLNEQDGDIANPNKELEEPRYQKEV